MMGWWMKQGPSCPSANSMPLRTVGYRELFAHFDGDLTREQAISAIKQHSRNYAKRQVTWDPPGEHVEPPSSDRSEEHAPVDRCG
jgi:tRNA A37 N6-isopentenylltransferase MiaA